MTDYNDDKDGNNDNENDNNSNKETNEERAQTQANGRQEHSYTGRLERWSIGSDRPRACDK